MGVWIQRSCPAPARIPGVMVPKKASASATAALASSSVRAVATVTPGASACRRGTQVLKSRP